jgi:hypothetical protein
MLEVALFTLGKIVVFIAVLALLLAAYHQFKFMEEWREDHAQSLSWTTRGALSTTAIFSRSLSDRCRDRRRRLLTAGAVFVACWILGVVISLGIQPMRP